MYKTMTAHMAGVPSLARMVGCGVAGAIVGPSGMPAVVGGSAGSSSLNTVLSEGTSVRTMAEAGSRFCKGVAEASGAPAAGTSPSSFTPLDPGSDTGTTASGTCSATPGAGEGGLSWSLPSAGGSGAGPSASEGGADGRGDDDVTPGVLITAGDGGLGVNPGKKPDPVLEMPPGVAGGPGGRLSGTAAGLGGSEVGELAGLLAGDGRGLAVGRGAGEGGRCAAVVGLGGGDDGSAAAA